MITKDIFNSALSNKLKEVLTVDKEDFQDPKKVKTIKDTSLDLINLKIKDLEATLSSRDEGIKVIKKKYQTLNNDKAFQEEIKAINYGYKGTEMLLCEIKDFKDFIEYDFIFCSQLIILPKEYLHNGKIVKFPQYYYNGSIIDFYWRYYKDYDYWIPTGNKKGKNFRQELTKIRHQYISNIINDTAKIRAEIKENKKKIEENKKKLEESKQKRKKILREIRRNKKKIKKLKTKVKNRAMSRN